METITNAANTAASVASKAIWGDQTASTETTSGTEPVSGQKGNTSEGEPFDKGNSDTATESAKDTTSSTTTTTTGPTTKNIDPADTTTTDNTKSTTVDPTTKDQGAADPKDEPAPKETEAIKDSKKEAEDAAEDAPQSSEAEGIAAAKKEAREADKVDVSGPGPKPLSELNKGAGASGPTGVDESEGPQKESKGEGTGEKYIKSSGLKAEGGDFDAANAGAGREADRLLEEKGIHREGGQTESKDGEDGEGGASLDKPSKPSLGDRIKAKFHKDKSDK